MKILKDVYSSFFNDGNGFSARKLSAFAAITLAMYITIYNLPQEHTIQALYAWLAFALLCLGIITVQNIIDLKNGNNSGINEAKQEQ